MDQAETDLIQRIRKMEYRRDNLGCFESDIHHLNRLHTELVALRQIGRE